MSVQTSAWMFRTVEELEARVKGLLEANNAELERRRAVEDALVATRRDSHGWQRLYHESLDEIAELERRIVELEEQRGLPF